MTSGTRPKAFPYGRILFALFAMTFWYTAIHLGHELHTQAAASGEVTWRYLLRNMEAGYFIFALTFLYTWAALFGNSLMGRNFTGELVMVTVVVLPFVLFAFIIHNMSVHQDARNWVRQSPAVIDAVGVVETVRTRHHNTSLSINGDAGRASFRMFVSGSKGSATVQLGLIRQDKTWRMVSVMLDGSPTAVMQ